MVQNLKKPSTLPTPGAFSLWLERYYLVFFCLLLGAIGFFCFYNLGQLPAQDWDEARHGVSAYEMLKSSNFLVNTYQYQPDYWNLKPPLSMWGAAAGMQLFGYSLFGMRFFSALSMLLMAALAGIFSLKRYGRLESLCVLLAMACSSPFYRYHFARHADADALFTLFATIALLAMVLAQEHDWAFPVCSGAFALAFLTKSWHALFVPAVVGVFFLMRGVFKQMKLRQWVAFILAGALPILLWGVLRFSQDGATFFLEMFRVDLLNRSTQVLENHSGDLFYYLRVACFSPSTSLLPIAASFGYYCLSTSKTRCVTIKPVIWKDFFAYSLWFVIPLILFSIAQTKLSWYFIPLMLPLVFFGGLFLAQSLRACRKSSPAGWIVCAACVAIVIASGRLTWNLIQPPFSDPMQNVLHTRSESLSATTGARVYLDPSLLTLSPQGGTQAYTLLGELYYDWRCIDGSIEQYLSDPDARLLLLSETAYQTASPSLADQQLLYCENGAVIIQKP